MPNISDSYFNLTIGPNGAKTEIRKKENATSIYLNLQESSRGGARTVNVQIVAVNPGHSSTDDRAYVVELGKKYMLCNDVHENGYSHVQLSFTGDEGVNIVGKWSSDSVPESGCSILR
jgi:hypothetical protein